MSEIVENYAKQYAEQYAKQYVKQYVKQEVEHVHLNDIKNLCTNMNLSVPQAMGALRIPDDVREDYSEKLRQDGYE